MTGIRNAGRRAGAATVLAVVALVGVACSSHSSATATSSSPTETSPSASPSPSPSPSPSTHPPAASTTAVKTTTSTAKTTPTRKTTAAVKPAPAPVDPLTGGKVSGNKVVVAKIDNTFFDVAQFGVSSADVVFVEQVEGGLTRLICVFHSNLNVEVGPVRSTRTTDIELLPVLGAKPVLVFSGANDGVLNQLHTQTTIIDSSAYNGYFRSDAAYGTYNLHANLAEVADQAPDATPARFIGFRFAASDPRVAKGPAVTSIQAVMQSGETDFSFSGGKFVRMRDGAVVHDYSGAVQAADNVLVMHVTDQPDGYTDSVGSPSYISATVGSGQVTLYRDGHAINGTWSRTAAANSFTFTDGHGGTLPMKPGHTWVILAPQTAQITTS